MPIIINKNDNGYWTCDLVSKIGKMNAGPAWPLIRWPKKLGVTPEEMLESYKSFGAEEMKDFTKQYEPFDEYVDDKIIFMGFKDKADAEKCKEWLESCSMMMKIERANNGKK